MSIFNSKQKVKIPFSDHNLSHNFSGSFQPGTIIPVLCLKVIPGDIFQIASSPDLRTQPAVSPFFTNTNVDFRYFYCRNMLVWPSFDIYITNRSRLTSPTPPTWVPPVHPYLAKFNGSRGSLMDYLYGAIDSNAGYEYIDALPARIYELIYSEYYRDEFLQTANLSYSDGQDNVSYALHQACYKKDYFTKSFPFTQAGDPVSLRARVVLDNKQNEQVFEDTVGNLVTAGDAEFVNHGSHTHMETSGTPGYPVYFDPNDTLGINIDIRDLRNANAVQRFLERSAVNGNRYAEFMLAHFGVRTADNSSFRPQYLGGGSVPLNVNPVEQTSPTSGAPLATQAGRGRVTGLVGLNKAYMFREYGWIMCLMTIRPDAEYCGGINRQFFVDGDRLDNYFLPVFQNVGMDEIKIRELAYPTSSANYSPTDVFSYQERGFQYKTMPNTVHGELAGGSMASWAVIRNFIGQTSKPQLNSSFVQVPTNAFGATQAVSGYPFFFGSIHHNIIARRPMQYRANYKL